MGALQRGSKIFVGWASVHLAPPIIGMYAYIVVNYLNLLLRKICKIGATRPHILNAPNSLSAGAPPQTQTLLRELTAFPQIL